MRPLPGDASGGGSGLVGLLHNGAFVAAFLGFFFAQSAKVFTHYYTERKWDFTRLISSGGMPSSHTALVGEGLRGDGAATRARLEQRLLALAWLLPAAAACA